MERTPEIRLKHAIGATQGDIMRQFILEATLLSLVGGDATIITVHGLTVMVAKTFNLLYEFDSHSTALSLRSALLVEWG